MIFEGLIQFSSPLNFELIEDANNKIYISSNNSFIHLELGHLPYLRYFLSIANSKTTQHSYSSHDKGDLILTNTNHSCLANAIEDFPTLDIAFIIDENNKISMIRNAFGTIPIYYFYLPSEVLIFSTNLSSLIRFKEVRRYLDVDPHTISTFCIHGESARETYSTSTFFKHIKNLLPGYILKIGGEILENTPYLQYNPGKYTGLKSKEEFSDTLFNLLKNSVNQATRQKPVGTHLSGGLDSSSVAALYKHLNPNEPLVSYYSLNETPNPNNINYAQLVADKINSVHVNIETAQNDLDILIKDIKNLGHPSYSVSSLAKTHSILQHAHANNLKVMLTGYGGDQVIGKGYDYLKNLFKTKNWASLNTELEKRINDSSNRYLHPNFIKKTEAKKLQIIKTHFLNYRIANLIDEIGLIKSFPTILKASHFFNLDKGVMLKRTIIHLIKKIKPAPIFKLTLKQSSIIDYYCEKINFNTVSSDKDYYSAIHDIYSKSIIHINEELFSLGNAYQIDIQLPFLDKDLLQLCAETPEEYKYYIGSGRGHLREAMSTLLPMEVVKREDKGYFNDYTQQAVIRLLNQSRDIIDKKNRVWSFINYDEYKKVEDAILSKNKNSKYYNQGSFYIFKIISLHVWFSWLDEIIHEA